MRKEPHTVASREKHFERRRSWARNFRNDHKYDNSPDTLMRYGRSTIPCNTSMIVGVKKGVVEPLPIHRRPVAMFEARTTQIIGVEDWSCIEVPLRMVTETRAKIAAMGNEIPVLPMEFVELIMREKKLSELASPHTS